MAPPVRPRPFDYVVALMLVAAALHWPVLFCGIFLLVALALAASA
jgi:hypothetical protein